MTPGRQREPGKSRVATESGSQNRRRRVARAYCLFVFSSLLWAELDGSRLLFAIRYGSNPLFEWMSAFHSSCLKLSLSVADAGIISDCRHKLTFMNKRNCKRNYFGHQLYKWQAYIQRPEQPERSHHFGRRNL